MVYIPVLAIVFGIVGTISLHLAKAFQRQGIDALKLKTDVEKRGKKSVIWTIGFILNNLVTVFAILAAMFGPASLYTAVFGLGLVVLLIYAQRVLHEQITRREIIGAVLIIIGTLGIGIVSIFYTTESPVVIYDTFFVSLWIVFPIVIGLVIVGYRTKKLTLTIMLFAPMGAMISAIGQNLMYVGNLGGGFYPAPMILAPLYVLGLLGGSISFVVSQIAFARGADASKYVSLYNGFYFVTPFIYELFIFILTPVDLMGFLIKIPFIAIVLLGIYFVIGILVRTMKKSEIPEEGSEKPEEK